MATTDNFIRGIEQYTLCCMAKDAGSKWSKPAKVFRMVDDAVEAINSLEARASGVKINMFTGLERQLKQPAAQPDTTKLLEQIVSNQEDLSARMTALEAK